MFMNKIYIYIFYIIYNTYIGGFYTLLTKKTTTNLAIDATNLEIGSNSSNNETKLYIHSTENLIHGDKWYFCRSDIG